MKKIMKKIIILVILFASIIYLGFGQTNTDSLEFRSDSLVYKIGDNKPFTGKCHGNVYKRDVTRHSRNIGWSYSFMGRYEELYVTGRYDNGKVNGRWTYKTKDGMLRGKQQYKNCIFHGKYLLYHHNGKLWKKFNYKNGKCTGFGYVYDEKGNLVFKARYDNGIEKKVFVNLLPEGEIFY